MEIGAFFSAEPLFPAHLQKVNPSLYELCMESIAQQILQCWEYLSRQNQSFQKIYSTGDLLCVQEVVTHGKLLYKEGHYLMDI